MNEQVRPAFYITGATLPDGSAVVYASDTVFEGEINYENELDDLYLDYINPARRRIAEETYTFMAKSRTITRTRGPDFASALRALFETWSPKEHAPEELSQPTRMLDQ